jgi:hypothetical protein
MTDGFSQTTGEILKVGASSAKDSAEKGDGQQLTVAIIIIVGALFIAVLQILNQKKRRPKNDVNVKY